MTTIDYLFRRVIPTACDLLPEEMRSPRATAMLLAIALQESKARARVQFNGPARGFWQFEIAGVAGVIRHAATKDHLLFALDTLCYKRTLKPAILQAALEDNDVLACVFARLNLWWLPSALPDSDAPDDGWRQYLEAWNPGTPRPETWPDNFARAWAIVNTPIETLTKHDRLLLKRLSVRED